MHLTFNARSIALGLALWALGCAASFAQAGDAVPEPDPDAAMRARIDNADSTAPTQTAAPTGHRELAPAPLVWKTIETRRFAWALKKHWILTLEEATTGTAIVPADTGGERRRAITQSRIRFSTDGPKPRDLGILQHVGSTEVLMLAPGDPRVSEIRAATDDAERPWPNTARLGFHDLDFPLDLDKNGHPEIAINQYASIADPAAQGILLVEADAQGRPRLLGLGELVRKIRFTESTLKEIRPPKKDASDPVLEAEFLPLVGCRFLAQVGIRGVPACDNCCTFPVLLHRGNSGYAPAYESVTQKILLDRVEGEIGEVAGLDPSVSLRSVDEAAIAEAAAVFYLTGTGQATRTELIRMLGWRGDDVRVRLLLDRLERFFLNGVAS